MNYWLLALRREKMEYCIKTGIFGLNRKYILGRVQPGDKVVCYATKENKIIATGEMTSEYYVDDTPVFIDKSLFGTDLFVDRVSFTAELIGKDHEVEFFQIIDQMSFVKSLANWQVVFRSAITQMNKNDWDVITKQIKFLPSSK